MLPELRIKPLSPFGQILVALPRQVCRFDLNVVVVREF